MSEENGVPEAEPAPTSVGEPAEEVETPEPREPMPPVENRFMFVDIAALRAKQLRRGALPRIASPTPESDGDALESSKKFERIAMREVEEGLIVYEVPDGSSGDSAAAAEGAS